MALRAGYYGLKNTVKKKLEKLAADTAGMKIIKTIGNGLKLTSAGTLSADIDTDTMEFKSGKLASKATALDYLTTEQNTGVKWVDGKDIYRKSYSVKSNIPDSGAAFDTISDLDELIDAEGSVVIAGNIIYMAFRATASHCFPQLVGGTQLSLSYSGSLTAFNLTIYYTKKTEE